MAHRRAYVDALTAEIGARRRETDEGIATIYLGGGTPSQLPAQEVGHIIDTIFNIYNVEPGAELTLEANPDDVTPEVAALWHNAGINRVSIGVQSLDDATLRAIGRRHTAQQAIEAVQTVRRAGECAGWISFRMTSLHLRKPYCILNFLNDGKRRKGERDVTCFRFC